MVNPRDIAREWEEEGDPQILFRLTARTIVWADPPVRSSPVIRHYFQQDSRVKGSYRWLKVQLHMQRGGGGVRGGAVLNLTVIIYDGGGWKHCPVTHVEVCDVLGSHESHCPWQGRKLSPALPTLSILSDDCWFFLGSGVAPLRT